MSSDVLSSEFYSINEIGLLKVHGPDSLDFLNRLSTQNLKEFGETTKVASTVFPTNQGKIVDWAWVIQGDDCLWIRTASGRGAVLKEWLEKFIIMEDVELEDQSASYRGCSIHAVNCQSFLGVEVGVNQVHFAHEGYWYAGLAALRHRLEGWLAVEEVSSVTTKLQEAGWKQASADDLEACRIATGIPSPSFEYDHQVSPLELRLMRDAIAWNKGCYIGQEVISRLDSYDKVKRLLMGFSTPETLPANEVIKVRKEGKTLGKVTSFIQLESGTTLGLGIIDRHSLDTLDVELTVGEQSLSAVLEERPFWK